MSRLAVEYRGVDTVQVESGGRQSGSRVCPGVYLADAKARDGSRIDSTRREGKRVFLIT